LRDRLAGAGRTARRRNEQNQRPKTSPGAVRFLSTSRHRYPQHDISYEPRVTKLADVRLYGIAAGLRNSG
jgi:hypothetical protein